MLKVRIKARTGVFGAPSPRAGRPLAFLLSVILHAAGIVSLNYTARPVHTRAEGRFLAAMRARQTRLIWYHFRKPPEISPVGAKREASAPQATNRDRITWRPDRPDPVPSPRRLSNLLAFEPPKATAPRPAIALPDPPRLSTAPVPKEAVAELARRTVQPPPPPRSTFVPPPAAVRPKQVAAAEPPRIVLTADSMAQAARLHALAIDLKPADKPSPPEGTGLANIASGPQGQAGPAGGSSPTGFEVEGLDLSVRTGPGTRPGSNTLVARTSYTTAEAIAQRRAIRSVPQSAARLPAHVREMFSGRHVSLALLEQPNRRHYSSEWLLWFAERAPLPGDDPRVQPPIPFRIVDPVSEQSTVVAAVKGRLRAAAVIRKTGFVDDVRLLFSLAARIDAAVRDTLRRWTFQPALRSGIMVDVDVLFEVAYDLRPEPAPAISKSE